MIEQLTNRYRVLSLLGQGGMGSVFLAEDATTGERVALKTLSLSQAADPAEATLRFRQEFRAMARLRHPNLVAVYDFGQLEDGTPYFTMEVVPGYGLDECLPLSCEETTDILSQLGHALAYIHQQGMVHCDIKPENIRLTPDGQLKLMDFGLMSPSGQTGGSIKGTLAYLAPEVARRSKVDARSDLYSLGALAYHLLSGRPPFPGEDPVTVLRAHLEQDPDPLLPLCPQVTPLLDRLVMRLLAKDPVDRYQSTAEVLAELGVVSDGDDRGTLYSSPFVGRASELSAFAERLATLDQGKAASLHLSGAAGLGKTRLLEEFRFQSQLGGYAVLTGRGQEEALPYGPFTDVLRGAIATLPQQAVEPFRVALSALLPELASPGSASTLDPQKEKARLQSAISDLLTLASKTQGLVILLDDWHWADPGSRELCELLARTLSDHPVLVTTASREAAETVSAIEPLGLDEVREMAEAIVGSRELDASFVRQLGEVTSGNPFFVESALRHLWQTGVLKRSGGRWVTEGLTLSSADLPSDVHDILIRRLARLSPLALEIAEVSAAMGQPYPLARLPKVVDCDEDALFEALGELAQEGILRSEEGEVRFVGGQYSELLYGRIAPEGKTRLHGRIAAVLVEELSGDERLEALFELARHHLLSDRPQEGVGFALSAARKSFALFGLEQAKHLLETGLLHAVEGRDRLSFLQLLGDIARYTSQLDRAEGFYHEALPLAEKLGLRTTEASIHYNLGMLCQVRSQYDLAIEKMQSALAILAKHPDAAESLRVQFALGRLHYFKGDSAQAIEITERALAMAREIDAVGSISSCLGLLGLLYVQGAPERITTGLAYLEESRVIKDRLGDKVGLNDTLNLLGNAQMSIGRFAEARASFERNLVLCREIGIRDDEICAMLNLGMMAYELGSFREAAEHWRAGYEAATGTGNVLYRGLALVWLATALANTGDLAEARRRLEAADALALETANTYLDVTVATFGIEVELMLGRLFEAMRRSERVVELVASSGITEYEPKHWALRAELLTRLGERQAAEAELDRMLGWAEENQAQGMRARSLVGRAWLASLSDDPETWLSTVEAALEATRACGAAYLEGFSHWIYGNVWVRLGKSAEARFAFECAEALAKKASCARLHLLALFGFAQVEGRTAKGYQLLPQARQALDALLERLETQEDREQLLALDELWRVQRGDLTVSVPRDKVSGGVPESQYLATLNELRTARERLDELETTNASLQGLIGFSTETQGMADLPALLDRIAALAVQLARANRGFVLLAEGDRLKIKGSTIDFRDRNPKSWQYSETIANQVFTEGKSVFLSDTTDRQDLSRSLTDLDIKMVLCVPLRHRDQVMGVVYVDRPTLGEPFNDRDRMLTETLAAQAAQAIVNSRLSTESEAHSRQLEMLNNLARTVSTTLVLSEVLDLVIDFTLKLTGADRAFILLTDDGELLRCHHAKDRMGTLLTDSGEKVSSSITQRVLSTLEAECVLDTKNHEQFQAQQSILDLNLRTVMCVPLMVKQEPLGVLYVDSQAVVNAFTDRDLDLLRAIASQASVAIQNAKLYERATVDGLTRLFVRSYFEQRMTSELRRTLRYGGTLSLMMMDIDHFKKFNDTYGHATGDEVLKLVARVIQEGVREELDIAGRFGGEEMLVLMPQTDVEGAMILAERLREAIASTDLPGPNGEVLHVSVSIGVASAPLHARTPVELVEFADQALYRSKRGGRNQVTLYEPLAPTEKH